jgi:hypothetical protein
METIMINPDAKEAFSDSICPNFDLRSTIIGMEPTISIGKSTIPTVIISLYLVP